MSRIHDALRRVEQNDDVLSVPEWSSSVSAGVRAPANGNHASVEAQPTLNAPAFSTAPRAVPDLGDCRRLPWKLDPRVVLAFDELQPSPAAEQFRALRSRLYQMRETQPLKSLVVTSALALEGKSFVATNLAHVLALHAERRVLLIDADLRTPLLHSTLGTSLTPGLTECLLREAAESEVIQKGSTGNLFFMAAGSAVRGPGELLSNGQFKTFIARLETFFDWIVIDSPSMTRFSDTCSLAAGCSGVLMVVRANSTPFDVVRKALERFPEEAILGVVLNEIGPEISVIKEAGERHAS